MRRSIVFLHAHPDDEALLTGGTISLLARQGHRVIIVTATDGGAGLIAPGVARDRHELAVLRRAELAQAAQELGAARVVHLGLTDSGLGGDGSASTAGLSAAGGEPFARLPVDEVAERVAEILREERATCLVGYDRAGGYGHPDHIQVHRVARRARQLADTALLLEASRPGWPFRVVGGAAQVGARLVPALPAAEVQSWTTAYSAKSALTHRVDVRPALAAKRQALLAHASQTSGGLRTIDVLLRLPAPLLQLVLGTEWFVGPANPQARWYHHPLESLHSARPPTRPTMPA